MRTFDKITIVLGLIGVVLAVGFIMPMVSSPSNCGGNSAAIAACKWYITEMRLAFDDSLSQMSVQNLSMSNRLELVNEIKRKSALWCGGARFSVRTDFTIEAEPKQIVIVCETSFDNVPQPTFWNGHRKTPAHAVGYSDFSIGLITPAEYKKLDLSGFLDIAEFGTNGEPQSLK